VRECLETLEEEVRESDREDFFGQKMLQFWIRLLLDEFEKCCETLQKRSDDSRFVLDIFVWNLIHTAECVCC
jgi:hypothetical protein